MKKLKMAGFSLVELMVTVAIVGILTAIAMPAYQSYILKSHRSAAVNGLLDAASREARYYTINNSYTTSMTALGYTADPMPVGTSTSTYFNISVSSVTAASTTAPANFVLQAVPQGTQVNDSCGTFGYSDLGQRTVSASTVASCWSQ